MQQQDVTLAARSYFFLHAEPTSEVYDAMVAVKMKSCLTDNNLSSVSSVM